MKLSIILITYNQEKYLEKSIESILNQHFLSEAEIIVADDYSTDKSFSIIQEKLRGCKWPVHYLPNNQNIGISANYQRAIQACSGEYIGVMEGDDYWTCRHTICMVSSRLYDRLPHRLSVFLSGREFHDVRWDDTLPSQPLCEWEGMSIDPGDVERTEMDGGNDTQHSSIEHPEPFREEPYCE
jgi:hypothetical protein